MNFRGETNNIQLGEPNFQTAAVKQQEKNKQKEKKTKPRQIGHYVDPILHLCRSINILEVPLRD